MITYAIYDEFRCENEENDANCLNAKEGEFKFYKSDSTILKKCATTISCFEKGSETYLDTRGHISGLETRGSLELYSNASLIVINNDSICSIGERSYLMIRNMLKINSARFILKTSAHVLNYGIIELERKADITVGQYSGIKVSHNGRIHLNHNCDIYVDEHSYLELFYKSNTIQNLKLKHKANINLYDFAVLRILSGGVTMMEESIIIMNGESSFVVDGFVLITKETTVAVNTRGRLYVGHTDVERLKGNANSSLIIASGGAGLNIFNGRKLVVEKGAHCWIKTSMMLEGDVTLNATSKNEELECFGNKKDLMKAFSVVNDS